MSMKRLRERWQPDQIAAVEAQFLAASRTPRQPDFASPFARTEEGLLDFHGITVRQAVQYATLSDADFSGFDQAGPTMRVRSLHLR